MLFNVNERLWLTGFDAVTAKNALGMIYLKHRNPLFSNLGTIFCGQTNTPGWTDGDTIATTRAFEHIVH